jgi:antitoxin HicB
VVIALGLQFHRRDPPFLADCRDSSAAGILNKSEVDAMQYKIPLVLTPQPEGGFTVTSPVLPELVTEGDSAEEALDNVRDALAAVVEIYQDTGRPMPRDIQILDLSLPLQFETVMTAP